MSYKLYTDKINKFQCTVQVEGTSLNNSQARIILETNDEISYLFKGKLHENGICDFNLPKFKNILKEGDHGVLRLEIIADDVHFEPWNSEFSIVADKKVNVVVQEQAVNEKPKISIGNITLDQSQQKPKIVETVKEQKPTQQVENKPVEKKKKQLILTKRQVAELLSRR